MKLSQYGYEFAPEMLAKHPTENRDDSRLMVINRAKGTVEHRIFKDIIEYFDEKDLFVFNDTKVFPARLVIAAMRYLNGGITRRDAATPFQMI